jgi:hypothetical protein
LSHKAVRLLLAALLLARKHTYIHMAQITKTETGTVVVFNDGETVAFKYPDANTIGMGLSNMGKDPFALVDAVVANCYQSGTIDKSVVTDKVVYLRQLEGIADDLCGKAACEAHEDVGAYRFYFPEYGVELYLSEITRSVYVASRIKSSQNPLSGIKHIVKGCASKGYEDVAQTVCDSLPMLLGLSERIERYLEYTATRLGN